MKSGFAIAIAWPETRCKQAGAWYDAVMSRLRVSRNGYYKVGHAALILVEGETGNCHYFDFGRYHSPAGHGRVRSSKTDHDLTIRTKAKFSGKRRKITNLDSILLEVFHNDSTHSQGPLYGSAVSVSFTQTLEFVSETQDQDFVPYGPFIRNGTNCSRFVNRALLAGKPSRWNRFWLRVPLTVSPTPKWNVTALLSKTKVVGHESECEVFEAEATESIAAA